MNIYNEEQMSELIKTTITETANGILEWVKNETDIVDKTNNIILDNAIIDLKENSQPIMSYVYKRLKDKGITITQ